MPRIKPAMIKALKYEIPPKKLDLARARVFEQTAGMSPAALNSFSAGVLLLNALVQAAAPTHRQLLLDSAALLVAADERIDSAVPTLDESALDFIVQGLSTFAWEEGFHTFCQVCHFDPESEYALAKWKDWQDLVKGLNAFDKTKLRALVQAGHKLPSEDSPSTTAPQNTDG